MTCYLPGFRVTADEMLLKYQGLLRIAYNSVLDPEHLTWKSNHVGSLYITNIKYEPDIDYDEEGFDNIRSIEIKFSCKASTISIVEVFGRTSHHHVRQPISRLIDGSIIPDFKIDYMICLFGTKEFCYQLDTLEKETFELDEYDPNP